MSRIKKLENIGITLILMLILSACYEPREGCLDIEAVNYELDADKNTLEDCIYPEFRLQVAHRYSTQDTIFRFRLRDSIYYDDFGQPFRVNDLRFYLSDLKLLFDNGQEMMLEDELAVYIRQPGGTVEMQVLEDNFALVNPSITQNYVIGTSTNSGNIQSLSFTLGLDDPANQIIPDSLPASHPLSLRDSSMYLGIDSGYVFQRIELFRDTTAADTIPEVLLIGTPGYQQHYAVDVVAAKDRGFHLLLTLQVDYRVWFRGINVKTDSKAALIEKIVGNLPEAFSVVSIVQQNQ
ncbi:MAG TPA: hypothetical protein PKA00_22785 [Saprospiraceae bacterium]|nr:hypothetical protein [Saprospiraceae bacterium]HMQ85755.1 hypothetical protein [Saprospiraceae bacterium]